MDNALSALFSWQLLLFSLGIFAVVWLIRTITEYFVPKADGNRLWEKLLLPIMPTIFGAIIAYVARSYPFPDALSVTSARIMFGAVSGMFSSLVYQVVKGMLKERIQAFISGAGLIGSPAVIPPPPPPITPPVTPITAPPSLMGGSTPLPPDNTTP